MPSTEFIQRHRKNPRGSLAAANDPASQKMMSVTPAAEISFHEQRKNQDRRFTLCVLVAFFAYFCAQFVLRIFLSPAAELDESEQLVLTQQLSLVYGSQPPLYTWLQWLVFQITGVGIPGLALLKNALLFTTYCGIFFLATSISGDPRRGALASCFTILIPQIAWESQRDLTHSVLVTTVCVLTLLGIRYLQIKPSASRFALLGLIVGIGILSKYNYALFVAAWVPAIFILPEFRSLFLRKEALIVPAFALIVAGPHLLAAVRQAATVTADIDKFGMDASAGGFLSILGGLGQLLVAVVSYLGPLIVVALIVLIHRLKSARLTPGDRLDSTAVRSWRKFLALTAVFAVSVCALLAILAGVTEFKDRWMQPLLFFSPVLVVLWIRGPIGSNALWMGTLAAILVGGLILISLYTRTHISSRGRLAAPFVSFSEAIQAKLLQPEVIFGGDRYIAGNLLLRFPNATVLSPETPNVPFDEAREAVAVWKPRPDGRNAGRMKTYLQNLHPQWKSQKPPIHLEFLRLHSSSETETLTVQPLTIPETYD